MLDFGYPHGEAFQQRLLALLVQHPNDASRIVQAQFFGSPVLAAIAGVVIKHHKEHPDATFSYVFLKGAVKVSLSKRALENWPLFKKEIKAAFRRLPNDKALLLGEAAKFAKECIYRDTLVECERCINAGTYDRIHELIQKAQDSSNARGATEVHWRDLPHPSDYPYEPVEWLIEGLIPEGAISVLSGNEGVGKTLFLLSMARSLTEGMDFIGRPTYPTPVIYLGIDVSKAILQRYLAMMRWVPSDDFRMLTLWTNPEAPMLDDKERMKWLFKYVEKYRPLLIFDTIRDFYSGDENSSTDTKPVVDILRRLCTSGGSMVLVAHPPKKGKSLIRGSGNIPEKADIPYFMQATKLHSEDVTVITCPRKNRFGSTSLTLTFQKQFIPIAGALPFVRIREVECPRPPIEPKKDGVLEKLIDYIKRNPGRNQEEITKELKMGDRTLKQALSDGETRGVLRYERGERKVKHWYVANPESHRTQEQIGSVVEEVTRKLSKPVS
jgi:hypothetical protein